MLGRGPHGAWPRGRSDVSLPAPLRRLGYVMAWLPWASLGRGPVARWRRQDLLWCVSVCECECVSVLYTRARTAVGGAW